MVVYNGLGFVVIDVGYWGMKFLELLFIYVYYVVVMVLVIVFEFVVDVDWLFYVFCDIYGDGVVFLFVVVLYEGGFFFVCF